MTDKNPTVPARTSRAPRAPRVTLSQIQRQLEGTQEQLSLIHAVLEELCERQEAVAAWQMEFSKRIVMLSEAHWRALEDFTDSDFNNPVERAFSDLGPIDPEMYDRFDEMSDVVETVNDDFAIRREERRKSEMRRSKKREKENPIVEQKDSIMVVPSKRIFN